MQRQPRIHWRAAAALLECRSDAETTRPQEAGLVEAISDSGSYGMALDPTFETLLSAPEEVYAFTAKNQVPDASPVTV